MADKRDQYLRLMAQGVSNSAACREVGINRKTGNRWRYGRKVVDRAGNVRVHLPITEVRESDAVSERFLSENARIVNRRPAPRRELPAHHCPGTRPRPSHD